MQRYQEELKPVKYGPSLVKLYQHHAAPQRVCLEVHWHDRMELLRLRQGEMTVGCENTQVLHTGEIYIIPPRMPHYAVSGKEGAQWDVMMFDVRSFYNSTELCRNHLEPIFNGRAKFRMCANVPELTECFDKTFQAVQENSFEAIPLVYGLIALLLRHALVEVGIDVKGRHAITQATEYMKENLGSEITTKGLAKRFGYSEEYFCRLFKEITQFSPMQYLKIFRLERAMRLLNEGTLPVSDIAISCGFSDPNYFTRCFKNFFGMTPTQMQKTDR